MSLTVNENEYGLTVSETPTHSLTVSGTSSPLTIASDDLTLTVSDTPTSLLTVTGSTDPSITVQDNNILLTIDQSTGSSGSNPFDQSLNTTDSPTFAAITVSGTVDGRDLSVDGTKLDGIAVQANKYVHPTYTSRSINTSGASVLDEFTSDVAGHVTNITTRTLTLADLGYTGATNADVTPSWVPSTNPNYLTAASTDLDSRYYTETETNGFLNLKANKLSPVFTGVPSAPNLTLTALSTYSGSDVTALMIKSNGVVGKRVLGSAAFSATSAFAPASHTSATNNPHSVTASQVGLGNVTNESKATMFASPTFTGTPTAPTPTLSDDSTKLATTEYVKGQTIAYSSLSGKPTIPSGNQIIDWTQDQGSTEIHAGNYINTDTLTSLALTNGSLVYTAEDGATTSISLAAYLDEDSRAIASGVLNATSGVVTFTRDDSTTFTLNLSALLDDTNLVTSVAGKSGVVTLVKGDVGLGNVTNESKATMFASPTFTGTLTTPNLTVSNLSPYSGSDVTALMINGSNVVGKRALGSAAFSATSDFAAASALGDYYTETEVNQFLNLKANKASPTFTGTITTPNLTVTNLSSYSGSDVTALMINGSNVVGKRALGSAAFSATGDFAAASHASDTSNPHSVTSSQVGLGNVTNESKATMFASPSFTGDVVITDDTFPFIKSSTHGATIGIKFSDDQAGSYAQHGTLTFKHADGASYGSGASFILGTSETTSTILADGKLMYGEGIYSKPATGTGAGTRKDSNWDTAYTHTSATNNPHSVTATQVGLGNVTNESKATMFASPTFTGAPTAPTPSLSDNNTNIATTEYVKGQSYLTASSTEVTSKAPIANPSFTGDVDVAGDLNLTGGQLEMRGDVALDHDGNSLYLKAPSSIFFYTGGNNNRGNINSVGNVTFTGSLTVSGGNSTNWNTAYGWGNHASAGYLTAASTDLDSRYYTETETNQFLNLKANLAGPTFTGSPKAPTPSLSDNNTNIATTEYVKGQNYLISTSAAVTSKLPLAGGTMTGSIDMGTNDITNAGEIEANEFIGNLRGAVSFTAKAGEALTKGDVVYISGISGNQTVVAKAEADDASKMPAFGVASETVTINANVTIINFGRVNNLDTSGFSEGDELFVSNTAGVLSSTTPTGESSALQKMAKVTRSHASAGSITVMGAGRSNAVPNLNEGRLFVGNSSNKAVADDTAYVDIANSRVGIGTTSPSNVLHVKSTTLNNGAAAKIENTRDGGSDHGLQVTANGSAGSFATRIQQQGAGDILQVLDGSTEVFTILDGGNVGIGTGSPAHKLDVAGAIRANGNIVTTSASQIMASRKFSALNTSGVMLTDSGASNGLSIANGGNATFSHNLTVSGDLTVNGTTTTINSTTVQVDDKNIELGTVATPTDATADGGGITLKGATDKTINWINSTDSWTSSERISITPAGSASLPALTFGGDNDTGIYRFVSGSDAYIGFSTAGSQRGYFGPAGITSSANVYSASGGEFRNYGGTWRGTTGQTGNGFQFINSVDGTAMTLSSTGAMVVTSSVSVPNLTLTNLSTYSGSDVTALMIAGGNVVGKRALGSNAFNSTAFITASSTDTLTNKTWNGNVIASAYLDADTAHLSGTQTFTGAKTFGNITSSGGYKANIAESSDADNITSNNIKYGYLANAASNKPVSGNSQYASVGNITLTHYDAASVDDFYIRAKAYNGNTSWAKIFTDQNSAFAPLASPALTGSPTAPTPSLSDNNTNIATTEYVKGQNYLISTSAAVTSKLPLAGGTITGNINLNDDVKIRFGAVQDFELYHASSGDSYIVNKTGILDIRNTVHGGDIKLQVENTSGTLEEYLRIDGGLGYTVSSKAIRIADGKALFLGDGEDLGIYHFASNNYIQNNLGDLIIQNDANDKDIIFKSDNGSGGVTEYFRLDGSSTGLTVSAPQGMVFFDNIKAKFGNNDDLQIYHNGSNSYVVNNTGDLEIINNTDDGDIKLISDDGSGGTATYFQLDGSQAQLKVHKDMVFHDSVRARFGTGTDFDIYHDGSNGYVVNNTGDLKIFNHTDDGKIDFTSDNGTGGTATYVSIDGSAVQTRFYKNTRHSDGVIALFGSSNDLQIFHDGSNSYIQDTGTGNFNLQSNSLRLLGADASAMLVAHQGGAVNLYHNGSAKLETTSSGIYVAGNIQLLDSSSTSFGRITFGHGNDLQIYHNGTESNITNATGNFYISQTANDADIIFECDNGSGGLTPYLTLDGSLSQMWADKDLQFSDNIKAKFGAGSDLQIYHNGSNSYVVNNTGDLEIINNTDDGDIIFKSDDGSGGVTPYLRLDGSHTQMLATKNLHFDDNVKALFGGYASPDLQIYHDGSHSFIKDTGTGDLKISSNTVRIESDGAESMIIASANGSVNLYYNNVNKLQTTSSGISVAGSVGVTNIVTNRIVKFNGSILDDSVMVDDGTNVGIGVTNPARKLHVSTGNTDVAARFENTTSNGNVIEVKTSGDNRTLNIQTDHIYSNGALHLGSDSYHTYIRGSKVGIRTTSPSYHLDVSGGIRAGGKVTYEKSAASLTTTGYAVAGLTSSPNGNGSSAGFTFTCFGHTGDYQRIVYSCYNTTGTWNTQKVIDEGTNDFDVTASANGSTITFTFKSRSGTKSYTPRVSVEAFGSSINNTYA